MCVMYSEIHRYSPKENHCFADASYFDGIAGIACVLKKPNNSIESLELYRITAKDNLHAELYAILKGVQMLSRKNLSQKIRVCSDNKVAVNYINKRAKCPRRYLSVVREIQYHKFSVSWVPRDKNKEADALAVYAVRRGSGYRIGR